MSTTRSLIGVLMALVVGATMLTPVHGQTEATTPRTPWGAPDLQGLWNYNTLTPLERPSALGGRASLTDEEAAGRSRGGGGESHQGRAEARLQPVLVREECDHPYRSGQTHLAHRRPSQRQASPVDASGSEARSRLARDMAAAYPCIVPHRFSVWDEPGAWSRGFLAIHPVSGELQRRAAHHAWGQ